MSFIDLISKIHPYTMEAFINISTSMLPQQMRLCPWNFVNHGTELLVNEDELCAYIAAYGEMHKLKCRGAFQNIDFEKLTNLEVWDWACGQGLASLTFIDMLREREKLHLLKKVTLIEPSSIALYRAEANIRTACPNVQVVAINKFLPASNGQENQINSTDYRYNIVIHLFSNILDIESVDLIKLAHLVASPGHSHYMMCVGPMNYGAYRIDRFASIFANKKQISIINNREYAYTNNRKRITCKANCFIHDGNTLNHCYDSSIVPIAQDGTYLINDYDVEGWFKRLGLSEKAIPFYKRLERCNQLTEHDSVFMSPEINGEIIDFIIVRPGKGITLINIYEGEPDIFKVIEQVNKLRKLQGNLMRKHLEEVWGKIAAKHKYIWTIVKMAIIFPDKSCNELYSWLRSLDVDIKKSLEFETIGENVPCGFNHVRFIGKDSLSNNKGAMQLGWFSHCYDNPAFSETTYKSILRILSPAWHSYLEGRGIVLDPTQEKLTKVPNVTKQINGVAGSGKTQILVQRAVNTHLYSGNPVLILSYNIALANYIQYRLNQVKADFSRSEFTILSYHRFFKITALKLGLKPTREISNHNNSTDLLENFDDIEFSYDDIDFFSSKASEIKRFDNIFIDEIQDFKPIWIDIIKKYFLSEGGEIVVLGDASQNIYHRPLDDKGQIKIEVARNGWNNSLRKSHRFLSKALSDLVVKFHETFITNTTSKFDPIQSSLFEEYKCLHYNFLDKDISIYKIAQLCYEVINSNQHPTYEIAIISNHIPIIRDIEEHLTKTFGLDTKTSFATNDEIRQVERVNQVYPEKDIKNIDRSKKIHFTVENQCLKLSTIHSFKGWETPLLILIIESDEENDELIYTALTRAREQLVIINQGNERYHSFFSNYQG